MRTNWLLPAFLVAVGVASIATQGRGLAPTAEDPNRRDRVRHVRSWAYWLSDPDVAILADTRYDALVVDPDEIAEDLPRLRAKHPERLILAYVNVGTAEPWRAYWRSPGGIAGPEDPIILKGQPTEWSEFIVRFWEPRWQALFLGEDGILQRVTRAGFDGVFLDNVDIARDMAETASSEEMQRAPAAMAAFVLSIAHTLRTGTGSEDMVLALQNPQILMTREGGAEHSTPTAAQRDALRAAVDWVSLESIWHHTPPAISRVGCAFDAGDAQDLAEAVNYPARDPVPERMRRIRRWRDGGEAPPLITVIDYFDARCLNYDPRAVEAFFARARGWDFLPYTGPRLLDGLPLGWAGVPPSAQGFEPESDEEG